MEANHWRSPMGRSEPRSMVVSGSVSRGAYLCLRALLHIKCNAAMADFPNSLTTCQIHSSTCLMRDWPCPAYRPEPSQNSLGQPRHD